MAITSITFPEEVSLARSPVLVQAASNMPVAEKSANRLRWTVSGSPAVGESVTIAYGDVSVTLGVLAVADDSGYTISQQGALTVENYARLLATELNRNYDLYANFEIKYIFQNGVHRVVFDPRGSTELTWTHTETLSNISIDAFAPTNSSYSPNPAILLLVEIYDQLTASYNSRYAHVLPVLERYSQVDFDIMSDFNLGPALPPANTIGSGGDYIIECADNWAKFRIFYAEQSGSPPSAKALAGGDTEFYALYGGNDYYNQYNPFWAFWLENGKFLTAAPRLQYVTYEQPVWLYWVGRAGSRDVAIHVQAYHRSGAESQYTRDSYAEQFGQVIAIKAGFYQLQLPEDDADPITRYEVWLKSDSEAVSEAFEFKVVGNCGEFTRYFLFANSLGGCDTVRTTGKHTTRLETTTQSGARIVTSATAPAGLGQDFDYNRRSRVTYEGSLGYKDAEYVAYLQDMLNAPAAWLVDVSQERFNAIQILAETIELLKDGEDLYTLRFRYRHAWQEAHAGIADDGQRIIINTDTTPPDIG